MSSDHYADFYLQDTRRKDLEGKLYERGFTDNEVEVATNLWDCTVNLHEVEANFRAFIKDPEWFMRNFENYTCAIADQREALDDAIGLLTDVGLIDKD